MGPADKQSFRFDEINQAPEGAGIYAWYYRIEVSDKDIALCISSVESAQVTKRAEIVRDFLERRIFRYFKESPYTVQLSGQLKPKFSGQVANDTMVSSSLVSRLAEDPRRLEGIKQALLASIPLFSSPIYIGIAESLCSRLRQHKKLIEAFRQAEAISLPYFEEDNKSQEAYRDHCFAKEVTSLRQFNVSDLQVFVLPLSIDPKIRIDVENILNRIYFPLCGRN